MRSTTSLTSCSTSRPLTLREDAVERVGPQRAALRQRDIERRQEFAQRIELFRRRLVVHAIDQRHMRARSQVSAAATLARIMNSSISRCASSRCGMIDAIDRAVGLEHDLALGKVEIERAALVAGVQHRAIGGVERLEDRARRCGSVASSVRPVDRELRLLVVQLRRRADHHAVEACASACGRRRR